MTIEERAKEHWPQPFIDYYGIRFFNKEQIRGAYMMGAREQLKIDIEKACKFWDDMMKTSCPDDVYEDWCKSTLEEFKQAMEE